jgi:short-subunit dehydrogenase
MKKAIIIGAASGMGRSLSKLLFNQGYQLALADINYCELKTLSAELGNNVIIKQIDVVAHAHARAILEAMIEELNGVSLFIYTAGLTDKTRQWKNEWLLYQVNAVGFAALASYVYDYWNGNDQDGHLVGISSVVAQRGLRQATAYCASKSFMKTYMQSLRHDIATKHRRIIITEIRPGYVRTPMTKQNEKVFWSISVEEASEKIYKAIIKKKKTAYLSLRWLIIGYLLLLIPDFIIHTKSIIKPITRLWQKIWGTGLLKTPA